MPANLQAILDFEEALLSYSSFRQFCTRTPSFPSDCDPSKMALLSHIFNSSDTADTPTIQATLKSATTATPELLRLIDSDYTATGEAHNLRGHLSFAGPIEGYSSFSDAPFRQREIYLRMVLQMEQLA